MFQRIRGILWRIRHVLIALTAFLCLLSVLQVASGLAPETRTVVVTSRDLSAGTLLEAGDLKVTAVPESLVPDGALSSIDQAEGEVLTGSLPGGMPLADPLLLSTEFLDSAPKGYAIMPVTIIADGTEELATPGTNVGLYAPPSEFDETAEAVRVVDHAVVVGHGNVPESSGFLGDTSDIRIIFLAIPDRDVSLVLGYGTNAALRIVLNSQ